MIDRDKLLHPRHRNDPDEPTIGRDGMSLNAALERARNNPKLYQPPIYSPEDITRFIIAFGEPIGPMQIASGLGVSTNNIAGHLFRAVHDGLLERSKAGGFTVYHPTPEALERYGDI